MNEFFRSYAEDSGVIVTVHPVYPKVPSRIVDIASNPLFVQMPYDQDADPFAPPTQITTKDGVTHASHYAVAPTEQGNLVGQWTFKKLEGEKNG